MKYLVLAWLFLQRPEMAKSVTSISQHPKGGGPAPTHTYKVSLITFTAQDLTSRPDCFLIIQYLCK